MPNGSGRVQALRTNVHAILNPMAAKHTEGVVETGQPLIGRRIAAIREEAVCLKQACRTHKAVRIPPEGRATGGAACTENALVQTVQL